jgi:glutamine amidotransferase
MPAPLVCLEYLRDSRSMCRLAAYLGPTVPLNRFLLEPPHSLVEQSWAPREMREARLNADGFGFGWFTGPEDPPSVYTNPMPIWTDPNLAGLGRALESGLWLAYVRSATRRTDVSHANTQPFAGASLLFMHNGYIDLFGETLRHHIRHALCTECERTIHGNTDSEYLFALLRQQLLDGRSLESGMMQLFDLLTQWAADVRLLLNFIITDGTRIVATRHAINGECPSLYYSDRVADLEGALCVASEPLTDRDQWESVPEHSLVLLDRDKGIVVRAL